MVQMEHIKGAHKVALSQCNAPLLCALPSKAFPCSSSSIFLESKSECATDQILTCCLLLSSLCLCGHAFICSRLLSDVGYLSPGELPPGLVGPKQSSTRCPAQLPAGAPVCPTNGPAHPPGRGSTLQWFGGHGMPDGNRFLSLSSSFTAVKG